MLKVIPAAANITRKDPASPSSLGRSDSVKTYWLFVNERRGQPSLSAGSIKQTYPILITADDTLKQIRQTLADKSQTTPDKIIVETRNETLTDDSKTAGELRLTERHAELNYRVEV